MKDRLYVMVCILAVDLIEFDILKCRVRMIDVLSDVLATTFERANKELGRTISAHLPESRHMQVARISTLATCPNATICHVVAAPP